jgi:tetratricopeptide (TPR) repeat protein
MLEARDAFAESEIVSERGLEIARRIGDRRTEAFMRAGNVSSHLLLGRWEEAIATADESDPTAAFAASTMLVVDVECRRGDVAEARERLGRYTVALETDDPSIRATHAVAEATILRAEGHAAAALKRAEEALPDSIERIGIGFIVTKLLLVEVLESAFELNDVQRLEELLGRIESLQPGERSPFLAAHAARFRAKLAPDEAAAEAGFRRAEAGFRELGLVFLLAVTQLEHAERLTDAGRTAEAQRLLDEARETFERLEAFPWLERTIRARPEEEPLADLVER